MSQPNTVAEAMELPNGEEPSAHFFGRDQEKNGLTEDLGQPKGERHEMTLDSMKHAIIMNKGDYNPYAIKIGFPALFQEYVLILNLRRIVFVARYFATKFREITLNDFCDEMNKLAGLMKAKVHEIDKKDGPPDLGAPEGSELAICYLKFMRSQRGGEVPHDDMTELRHSFKNRAVRLKNFPYGPEACTLVIAQGNTGVSAKHSLIPIANERALVEAYDP